MSEVDYGKGWALSAIWEFRKLPLPSVDVLL